MTMLERRSAVRTLLVVGDPARTIRLRSGDPLTVIDLSDRGALVESMVRLIPGVRVAVHLTTKAGRILVRGWVVRCAVVRVEADAVAYRGAIGFDDDVDL